MNKGVLLNFITLITYCGANFQILKEGERSTIYVVDGKEASLDCHTNQKFYKCQWSRPGNSETCGVFESQSQQCPNELDEENGAKISVAPWRVEGSALDKCAVTIDSVSLNEVGDWTCTMESLPESGNKYSQDSRKVELRRIRQPRLSLQEPVILEIDEGEHHTFTCDISGMAEPKPSKLLWTLDGQEISGQESAGSFSVQATIDRSWSGKTIKCAVTQQDSFGNFVRTEDERKIVVNKVVKGQTFVSKTTRVGTFNLGNRYPRESSILLASDVSTTFSCSTTSPWYDCKWKHPKHEAPCSIFHDTPSKLCEWVSPDGGRWTVRAVSESECTITVDKVHSVDIGQWNCALGSFPVQNDHDKYLSVQEFFEVALVIKATVDNGQLPPETSLTEGEERDFSVQIRNGNVHPPPEFVWYLDGHQLQVASKIRYEAKLTDSGKRLICKVIQEDDESNHIESSLSTLLRISARPAEPAGMNVLSISLIVSGCVLVILVAIVLLFLWRTERACFGKAEPVSIYIERTRQRPAQGDAQVQMSSRNEGLDASVGANFGPSKPLRSASKDNLLTEPLLGSEPRTDVSKLEVLLAADELQVWSDEGSEMSKATSLSSLDTQVSSQDWSDTLRTFGPKFAHLVDMVSANCSSSDSDEHDDGGTEV